MSTTQNHGRELGNLFAETVEILDSRTGLATAEAQMTAAWLTCMVAMRMHYSWASLRVALAGYPELLAATGGRDGLVDVNPFR